MNDIFENTETMKENEHPRFYTAEYTAIVRDKLLRCPMLVVCSRNQDATTNAQIGLAQKYNRIVTTLDGLKKAVSEGDDLVS